LRRPDSAQIKSTRPPARGDFQHRGSSTTGSPNSWSTRARRAKSYGGRSSATGGRCKKTWKN